MGKNLRKSKQTKKDIVVLMLEAHQLAMESSHISEEDQNKEVKLQQ